MENCSWQVKERDNTNHAYESANEAISDPLKDLEVEYIVSTSLSGCWWDEEN